MKRKILCINGAGKGDLHEFRARELAGRLEHDVTFVNVDKTVSARKAVSDLWGLIASTQWDLVYQESSGFLGGLCLIRAAISRNQAFVVSSGDPISGYFRATRGAAAGAAFGVFEKLLYRTSAGFIGWTPYLTGRAMHLGAPRAVTVEGAVDLDLFAPSTDSERAAVRERYNIPRNHLLCGVVGSLNWRPRHGYCYGLELIEMVKRIHRKDVSVLIIGDGTGRAVLESKLPENLRSRVAFAGKMPQRDIPQMISAMDIGFVTQTLDTLGSYRLTTKLPEYLACGTPVAMSPVPGFYDYAQAAGWPLPAFHPADPRSHVETARWIDALRPDEVTQKAGMARVLAARHFNYDAIGLKFSAFIDDLLNARPVSSAQAARAPEPVILG